MPPADPARTHPHGAQASLQSWEVGGDGQAAMGLPKLGEAPTGLVAADAELAKALKSKTDDDEHFWCMPDRDRRTLVHSLFQYPAMMVPEVQQRLIQTVIDCQPGVQSVYDPFVGAGSTLVAGMQLGLDSYGQDINPLSVLLSRVKTGPFFCERLEDHVGDVCRQSQGDPSSARGVRFKGRDKWFEPSVQIELSRLQRAIRTKPLWARRFMWVILAETIRLTSNDRTSTYKLHIRSSEDLAKRSVSPLRMFKSLALRACEDVRAYRDGLGENGLLARNRFTRDARVSLGSTQQCARQMAGRGEGYDLLVTSPPYGDNHTTVTYGQHAYLPLQWIDLDDIDPRADTSFLRTISEIDSRSLGGSRNRAQTQQIVGRLSERSPSLKATFALLESEPTDRTSRVAFFYRDLDDCLRNIVEVMKGNAYMCWTVANRRVGGQKIPTHRVLRELLEHRGATYVTEVQRQIYSRRMPTRNDRASMMRSERILVFRTMPGSER